MKETPQQAVLRKLFDRIETLGTISSDTPGLTRVFLSKEMDIASRLIQSWMSNAGLIASVDRMQNVVGSWPAETAHPPAIHIGSHYDTVINAGKYDGPLGVLLSIAAVETLRLEGYEPKHPINVAAFCDEEGVRFRSTFLGSSFFCGTFDTRFLDNVDDAGNSMRSLLELRGFDTSSFNQGTPLIGKDDLFLEAHIEQGPILERLNLSLGVVSGIAAQTRIHVTITGESGHAGTTPLDLRRDALTTAAEMILAVEASFADNPNARATVGQIKNYPNATNAIPGEVEFMIDLRNPVTAGLNQMRDTLLNKLDEIAARRTTEFKAEILQTVDSITCDSNVQQALSKALAKHQERVTTFTSGAGHDALKIAQTCRTGMMFVRCRNGLSHHPDEYCSPKDIEVALAAWVDTLRELDQNFPTPEKANA
ncbi:M20 family metallo-hydrolase [Pelagicoccus sp. SDUM812002]|uniref:M20 family metallo-hydrolase n=1 Tax=Pelagicoccus sp. SDUM812002 TaxID=3041266 RepID=UPI0028100A27|nr:M20 family metallo-hydrolase [Pelagicoccus sp. SDUM812002]MDQ8187768.1 M20 family metallo-hydrolase [Pelagicoccus sp. SDUM812002]